MEMPVKMPHTRRRKQKEFLQKKKRCNYCKRDDVQLTLDHKVAKINGGEDTVTNYQALCTDCNGTKSNIDHRRLMSIAKWVYKVNKERAKHGKRPLGVKKKELLED